MKFICNLVLEAFTRQGMCNPKSWQKEVGNCRDLEELRLQCRMRMFRLPLCFGALQILCYQISTLSIEHKFQNDS